MLARLMRLRLSTHPPMTCFAFTASANFNDLPADYAFAFIGETLAAWSLMLFAMLRRQGGFSPNTKKCFANLALRQYGWRQLLKFQIADVAPFMLALDICYLMLYAHYRDDLLA